MGRADTQAAPTVSWTIGGLTWVKGRKQADETVISVDEREAKFEKIITPKWTKDPGNWAMEEVTVTCRAEGIGERTIIKFERPQSKELRAAGDEVSLKWTAVTSGDELKIEGNVLTGLFYHTNDQGAGPNPHGSVADMLDKWDSEEVGSVVVNLDVIGRLRKKDPVVIGCGPFNDKELDKARITFEVKD